MRINGRTASLSIGMIVTTLLLASAASAEERAFDRRFTVTAGGTLTVKADIGAVTVAGGDTNEVVIHAIVSGDRHFVDDYTIEADSVSQGVTVNGHYDIGNWFDFSWMGADRTVRFTIQIPRNYHVQVHNARGDMELRDFNGSAYGQTSRGSVVVKGINGAVDINSSRGDVHGSALTGAVSLVTSRGEVTLDKVVGPVRVRSSRGNVEVELANPNHGADVATSRGNVVIKLPPKFAADLEARTSRGEVECDAPLAGRDHDSSNRRQSLSGTLNGGGKLLKLTTSRGDIEIRSGS